MGIAILPETVAAIQKARISIRDIALVLQDE